MKRCYLLVLVVAFSAGAAGFAAAASLSVASDTLAGGTAAVSACDTDGVSYGARGIDTTASHNVTSLVVSSIAVACAGSTLTVTLANGTGAALETASLALPSSGFTGSATVTFTGTAPAASIASYRIAIVGS